MKDYSGRRPVSKNRPRKQPVGIFVIILISAVSMSFALGVLTGWVIHRPALQAAQNQQNPADGDKTGLLPQQFRQQNPEGGAAKGVDPPLTFYETLPKGGKAIIGSGLNPRKSEEQAHKAPPPAQTAPVPAPAASAAPAAARPEAKEPPAAPPKQPEAAGKFCIQVASTQVRAEAEALRSKLAEKGFPVYIVESTIKDRGTWFRVRAGKHLSQQAAGEMAAKAGKGAIVITE